MCKNLSIRCSHCIFKCNFRFYIKIVMGKVSPLNYHFSVILLMLHDVSFHLYFDNNIADTRGSLPETFQRRLLPCTPTPLFVFLKRSRGRVQNANEAPRRLLFCPLGSRLTYPSLNAKYELWCRRARYRGIPYNA